MSERDKTFDILKAIGIILVIVGHTVDIGIVFNMISSFHMPLFFLVSGYFFKMKSPTALVRHLPKRLLTPYILSCGIIVILSCIIHTVETQNFNLPFLQNWIISIFYGNGVTNGTIFQSIGPLWFLLALFWATIILHIILFFQDKISPFFSVILCIIVSFYLSKHQIVLPLSVSQGMFGVIFMYIGYLMKQYHPSIKVGSNIGLLPIIFIWIMSFKSGFLSPVQCYANPELLTLTGALCGTYLAYLVSCKISISNGKFCFITAYIGRITLLILCVHSIEWVLIPWQTLIKSIDLNYYLSSCIVIVLRIICVLSVSWALQKIKTVQLLFNV